MLGLLYTFTWKNKTIQVRVVLIVYVPIRGERIVEHLLRFS